MLVSSLMRPASLHAGGAGSALTCACICAATTRLRPPAVRSKKDAELLYDAKYGERGPDGKMTREQYQCVARVQALSRECWRCRPWHAGLTVKLTPCCCASLCRLQGAAPQDWRHGA